MEANGESIGSPSFKATYYGLTKEKYDDRYGKPNDSPKTWKDKINHLRNGCDSWCTRSSALRFMEARIPAIHVIRTYKFKKYIFGDIIAGLSVGIMTIPQSMGYAILASVPAILGLYTCLIPAVIYFIFGTSRHIAMGTMALSSLIIANAVERGTVHLNALIKETDPENTTTLANLTAELEEKQIAIAVSVTFLGGLILILMSFLHLGFIITYMGDAFVSGYLTGANIRVLTHQVVYCFGLKDYISHHSGFLNYFYLVIEMFTNIKHTNIATLVTSVITLAIILGIKYGVNEKFKSKIKVPVPIELIVVIVGIIISHFAQFDSRFGVRIVRHVPQGMPKPTLPDPDLMKDYALEAALMGIVSFVFAGMIAKLFCARHNYTVSNNQELFASGMCNTIGGLFSCIGVSVSPPRAFLMEMTGGHTQVAYLVNAVLILLTLFFLAPFLHALPVCILACLVITSCIPLFVHYTACITYWKTSKFDFSIWLVTMVSTLAINVDIGMILGVGYSFLVIIYQSQRPYTTSLNRHQEDGVFIDSKKYTYCKQVSGIRVFKFESPLYFATLEIFKEKLFSHTVSLSALKTSQKSQEMHVTNGNRNNKKKTTKPSRGTEVTLEVIGCNGNEDDDLDKIHESATSVYTPLTHRKHPSQNAPSPPESCDIHTIVVDCSSIPFADTPGARLLSRLHTEYLDFDVDFLLASCSDQVLSIMSRVPECQGIINRCVYPSVTDAVLQAEYQHGGK